MAAHALARRLGAAQIMRVVPQRSRRSDCADTSSRLILTGSLDERQRDALRITMEKVADELATRDGEAHNSA
jgi:hypothetical protein